MLKHRSPSRRRLDDVIILAHIRNQFALSREIYGSPRMHVELNEEGIQAGRHRTARLMRENDLKARWKTRFKRTTEAIKAGKVHSAGCKVYYLSSTYNYALYCSDQQVDILWP